MATPLSRRPEPGDESSRPVPAGSATGGYLLPATARGVAVLVIVAAAGLAAARRADR